MIREEVKRLAALGPMPSSDATTPEQVDQFGSLVLQIPRPLSDEEARLLLHSFGDDDYFGVSWELLHLIETAPHVAVESPPDEIANEWMHRIWDRAQRGKQRGTDAR